MAKDEFTSASPPTRKRARKPRALSASEISRNARYFDMWSSYQGCESVAFSDLPVEFRTVVGQVFDTSGRLPRAWVDSTSEHHITLTATCSTEFMSFLQSVNESCPDLFSDSVSVEGSMRLLDSLRCVFVAWDRLHELRKCVEKISEAAMVANVYEVLRSPAVTASNYRAKCPISLAKPLSHLRLTPESLRVVSAATVVPDATLFIPHKQTRCLSHVAKSPFKKLKKNPLAGKPGRSEASFAGQSTPCAQLPAVPCFEFASSFWEDKKPSLPMLEDAYRQNRMSTTAAVRHLHSLHINAPVFGLIWADATVRAHVDWCMGCQDGTVSVYSAPYPGSRTLNDSNIFQEWHLADAADAVKVFLLIKNIDAYTTNHFANVVYAGIAELEESVESGKPYRPWKRSGTLSAMPLQELQNISNISSSLESSAPKSTGHKPCKCKQQRHQKQKVGKCMCFH